ncbi:MAG: preprotein translocase subunit SecA [Eubacteriales bacterium]|nr:preprotein translocase subunit SecA [Eubacteriales bacterium]
MGFIDKLFGSHSDREIKRIKPLVEAVEAFEGQLAALSEDELQGQTARLKARLAAGESLDDILPEAFATVREAAKRVLEMKHYPVQILGGIVLHQGRIAEMKTGEGKTLVATLAVYLNALTGKGVHVVTVNDYLAKRDSEWMGKVYRYLGLSVGLIVHGLDNEQRRAAYRADITYGTNNEFGFDYLRDNMVTYKEQCVQRELNFAIVDEVDSILIDEARTPLIISGMGDESSDLYERANRLVKGFKARVIQESDDKQDLEEIGSEVDYIVDEKAKTAVLTARGIQKAERFFAIENLSDQENYEINHHVNNALRAYGIMHRDQDYVLKDGEVVIVDDFTGRLMFGRRYSNGLHQAIEAKEGVKVANENKTLATITFQNYFRMYRKLSGMTGTALTEENEFRAIYSLDVVCIPTNRPMVRLDQPDAVFKTQNGKYTALLREVLAAHEKGQPILIGTISVDKSEYISSLFRKNGIPHNVLNAKQHEREAEIVAQAGRLGAVTIATNMAGRGTDILLGGNPEFMAKQELRKSGLDEALIDASTTHNETSDPLILSAREQFARLHEQFKNKTSHERDAVMSAGGLYILGTERHESRRIDNQLRGRSGRQGDPGRSKFYLSLEDDLMRLFGGDRMTTVFAALGVDEDMEIEHAMLSKAIESAQKKVEGRNFGIRKHVLEYDDVMNKQRELIYRQRRQVLEGEDLHGNFLKMIRSSVTEIMLDFCAGQPNSSEWDIAGIKAKVLDICGDLPSLRKLSDTRTGLAQQGLDAEELTEELVTDALARFESRVDDIGSPDLMREAERVILLRTVDSHWMDHIDQMDDLRDSIGMRGYAQHDPVIEYKKEGFALYEAMTRAIQEDSVRLMMRARFNVENIQKRHAVAKNLTEGHGGSGYAGDEAAPQVPAVAGQPASRSSHPAAPRAQAPQSAPAVPQRRDEAKVGRNDPCPCGSGKKYKNCHGKNEN